jgi:hypothetical protein
MPAVSAKKGSFTLKAYPGDAKTLLAFNLSAKDAKDLAGFTIQVKPDGQKPYFLFNTITFEHPENHNQVAGEASQSSVNSPLHKFAWLHIPGTNHQGITPFRGKYTYTVTPRYVEDESLQPLDPSRSTSVTIDVVPFVKGNIELGFARGFVQSQAYVRHFGPKLLLKPGGDDVIFDTSKVAGKRADHETGAQADFTFAEEFDWLGFTAREKVFAILNEVLNDKTLHVDIFAYDLNEPDVVRIMCELAAQGRIRVILDNAALHHDPKGDKPKAEDKVEGLFNAKKKKDAVLIRGKFKRYAHDKVFVVSRASKPLKVLTGSTNFSITGMYVNSNHVVIFKDADIARTYQDVFDKALALKVSGPKFAKDPLGAQEFSFSSAKTPQTEISFAPHPDQTAAQILNDLTARIGQEAKKTAGSVLFAVMEIGNRTGPVFPALKKLHSTQNVFSYGISDTTDGIQLYRPGTKRGVLVTGKPTKARLPKPFSQVPSLGLGHQVHHKFVVCGFTRPDAVVYCGSSNLAQGGETSNGDNLIAIHDQDVATAFAIEAIGLVDHFNFLDAQSSPTTPSKSTTFLGVTDKWTKPYFDENDLRMAERELLA